MLFKSSGVAILPPLTCSGQPIFQRASHPNLARVGSMHFRHVRCYPFPFPAKGGWGILSGMQLARTLLRWDGWEAEGGGRGQAWWRVCLQ